jgi:hypothetical protein
MKPAYSFIYIIYNNKPKGEARGLDPGTSPNAYALTIAPLLLGQMAPLFIPPTIFI